jgi:hypothetical protein
MYCELQYIIHDGETTKQNKKQKMFDEWSKPGLLLTGS